MENSVTNFIGILFGFIVLGAGVVPVFLAIQSVILKDRNICTLRFGLLGPLVFFLYFYLNIILEIPMSIWLHIAFWLIAIVCFALHIRFETKKK